ncbi:MAG: hypothetical protein IT385_00500 [Deltaproteobacteria bacterium]|nr:hypothetical protein [Deltaproteobacteria bacterium]
MKRFILGVVAGVAMMMGLGQARAIDLRNEDGRAHSVTVTSSSMSRELALGANTLSLVVCVGTCTFEVAGVGVVSARGSDVVTIKHGRVTSTPRVAREDARVR